jgi:hypothetical protein
VVLSPAPGPTLGSSIDTAIELSSFECAFCSLVISVALFGSSRFFLFHCSNKPPLHSLTILSFGTLTKRASFSPRMIEGRNSFYTGSYRTRWELLASSQWMWPLPGLASDQNRRWTSDRGRSATLRIGRAARPDRDKSRCNLRRASRFHSNPRTTIQ